MTTRLEIINAVLAVNGESPVSSEASIDPAAIQAKNLLSLVDRKVQARGWYFNKEDMTLSPNLTGEVICPSNALAVDPVDTRSQYVKRGSRLYDRKNNTFTISKDVICTVVLQLEIEDIPTLAADYIEAKTRREHFRNEDGDIQTVNSLKQDEAESYAFLQREELANEDVNIRRSPLGLRLLKDTRSTTTEYIDRGA